MEDKTHINIIYVWLVLLTIGVVICLFHCINKFEGFNPNILPYRTNGFGMNLQSSRPVPFPLEQSMNQPWKVVLNPPIDYPMKPQKYVASNLSWNSRNKRN